MGRSGHEPGAVLKPLVEMGKAADACWKWLGNHDANGVPTKTYCGDHMPARRWLWMQIFGPIDAGIVISTMPTCGNKACMNPWHFRACHQADANRSGVGSVLMPADVTQIKRAKNSRTMHTAAHLAERIGCSTTAIHDIWRGRTWKSAKAPNHGPRRNARSGSSAPEAAGASP